MKKVTIDRKALRALCEAATPAEKWIDEWDEDGSPCSVLAQIKYQIGDADFDFITAAREAVPALLDEVERLENIVRAHEPDWNDP